MATILTRERQLYTDLYTRVEAYTDHALGEEHVPHLLDMAGIGDGAYHFSILDAGCGTGKGALALQRAGFRRVLLCDFTDAGLVPEARALPYTDAVLWDPIDVGYLDGGTVDYVYCCDVLEHIPTAFTMLVVARLLAVARRGVFLSIALEPDNFGVWVGTALHQTVQSFTWWRDAIAEVGTLREARDCFTRGLYFVEPR